MTRKRKRAVSAIAQADTEAKRPKLAASLGKIQYHTSAFGRFPATVLDIYYPKVISLRQFLLSKLPASSTSRRRLLSGLGRERSDHHGTDHFFDSTLVGVLKEPQELIQEARKRDFANFTQSSQRAISGTKSSTQSYQVEEVSQFYTPCLLGPVPLRLRPIKIEGALMIRSDCGLCNLGLVL
jgi:telomerase reverse transcriptase